MRIYVRLVMQELWPLWPRLQKCQKLPFVV